jgi:hypothetical protein
LLHCDAWLTTGRGVANIYLLWRCHLLLLAMTSVLMSSAIQHTSISSCSHLATLHTSQRVLSFQAFICSFKPAKLDMSAG